MIQKTQESYTNYTNQSYYNKQVIGNAKLYYRTLCPFSRFIKILLSECNIEFTKECIGHVHDQVEISPIMEFSLEKKFLSNDASRIYKQNIASELIEISGFYAITEQINEIYNIYSDKILQKANTRTFCESFNSQLYPEIIKPVIHEKVVKFYHDRGLPDSKILFTKLSELSSYLKIINEILEQKNCITSDTLSIADFCLAAHISCLDYLGSITWENFLNLKKWYLRIKSRPSFQQILQEKIPSITPSKHYCILDF